MPTTHHLSSAADAVSGASSIERLATEIALAGQTRKFKTLCF
jgi:predicted TIM-barrel enzyme